MTRIQCWLTYIACIASALTAGLYAAEHNLSSPYYLDEFTQPWHDAEEAPDRIEFSFEDAQLINVIRYVEKQFGITFILDDALDPVPKGGQSALGTKVTFTTHTPLTKDQAWDVFLTFLDMAGLAPRPGPYEGSYRITTIDPKSNMSIYNDPLPTYIGVHPDQLPESDIRIRYMYFVRNASMDVIKNVMESMKSSQSPQLVPFPDMRGIMITEKAFNVQAIMRIIRELDTVNQPETMSIIKLKRTDATRVAELYKSLAKEDDKQQNLSSRLLGNKREQTVRYFPSGTRVIPEPRTNTLIILGTQSSIEKIESFIANEIDREVSVPFTTTHIYTLNYIEAEAAKQVLEQAIQFQSNTPAGQYGGTRDGDQYMKPASIAAEATGNRLIITADYAEYYQIEEILKKLDVEQPQVGIKVLIININLNDTREAGTQLRNKVPGTEGLLSEQVNFQTSGLAGSSNVVTNDSQGTTGAQRLLGDLINLAARSNTAGATFLTLGSDQFGIWGIFRLLQTYAHTNIISNPFLITANKNEAEISVGEERRVQSAITSGQQPVTSFTSINADLSVKITPQISYEGFVTLDVRVTDNQFTGPSGDEITAGNRSERIVENSVIMADQETLALGGLIRTRYQESESGVPGLKNIPGLGYLFKNKSKTYTRDSLLILISPEIIPAQNTHKAARYTNSKVETAKETVRKREYNYIKQDPFHRWFFKETEDQGLQQIDDYMQREGAYTTFATQNGAQPPSQDTSSSSPQKNGKQTLSKFIS